MGRILDAWQAFFDGDDWNYVALDDQPAFRLPFQGHQQTWVCVARARELQEQAMFYSVLPIHVPMARRPAMLEFVARANHGMILGCFELDVADGEIRFRTALDLEGVPDPLPVALFRQIVHANVLTTDRYVSGIMEVAFGDADPADTLARIEGSGPPGADA